MKAERQKWKLRRGGGRKGGMEGGTCWLIQAKALYADRHICLILQVPTERSQSSSPILTISKARPEEDKGLGIDHFVQRDRETSARDFKAIPLSAKKLQLSKVSDTHTLTPPGFPAELQRHSSQQAGCEFSKSSFLLRSYLGQSCLSVPVCSVTGPVTSDQLGKTGTLIPHSQLSRDNRRPADTNAGQVRISKCC